MPISPTPVAFEVGARINEAILEATKPMRDFEDKLKEISTRLGAIGRDPSPLTHDELIMADFIGLCETSYTPELWSLLEQTCESLTSIRSGGGSMDCNSFSKCLKIRGHTTPSTHKGS